MEPADGQDGRQERCFSSCQGQDPVCLPKEKRPGQAPCDTSQPLHSVLTTVGRWSSLLVDLSPPCRHCSSPSLCHPSPSSPAIRTKVPCGQATRSVPSQNGSWMLPRTREASWSGWGDEERLVGAAGRKKDRRAGPQHLPPPRGCRSAPRARSGPSLQKTLDLGLDLQREELPGQQSWALRVRCC